MWCPSPAGGPSFHTTRRNKVEFPGAPLFALLLHAKGGGLEFLRSATTAKHTPSFLSLTLVRISANIQGTYGWRTLRFLRDGGGPPAGCPTLRDFVSREGWGFRVPTIVNHSKVRPIFSIVCPRQCFYEHSAAGYHSFISRGTRNYKSNGKLKNPSTSTLTTAVVSSDFAMRQLHRCGTSKQCRAKRRAAGQIETHRKTKDEE
jgi:hypothetical protein